MERFADTFKGANYAENFPESDFMAVLKLEIVNGVKDQKQTNWDLDLVAVRIKENLSVVGLRNVDEENSPRDRLSGF